MIDQEYIHAAEQDLAGRILRCFTPPPTLTTDQWADKYRELSRISNAKGGKWRTRCFQREIMATCTDPNTRSVVFIGAAQAGGKSEIILNFIGRQIHLNPGPMMLVQPTNELAERFGKKRVAPMLRDTSVLRPLCGEIKSRTSKQTIRAKEFPGGALNIAGANTPNELCSDPQRDVLIDEVDRCEASAGVEGDIVTLAEQRQETFGKAAFSLYTSTPSGFRPVDGADKQPLGVSKILMLFAESDQRQWFCPCQKCGTRQTLKWRQVDFSKAGTREEPRYICENDACRHPHTDAERIRMIETGQWIATAPFNGRAGFLLPGIYSLSAPQRGSKTRMQQMVSDFLRAKQRGNEALTAWSNTFLCECSDAEEVSPPDATPLFSRRREFGELLPERCCKITCGIDEQDNRLEAQVIGWGEGEEAWALDYYVVYGDPRHKSTWAALRRLLLKTYEHPCGAIIPISRGGVDTSFAACYDQAVEFARENMDIGMTPVRGFEGIDSPVMNMPKKEGTARHSVWKVSTTAAKTIIYARLRQIDEGPAFIHFRSDREPMFMEDYFKQLTSERVVVKMRAGREYYAFIENGRNEAFDTFVYALAALRRGRVDFKKLMARMLADAEAAKAPKKEAVAVAQPRSRSGLGTGWNL